MSNDIREELEKAYEAEPEETPEVEEAATEEESPVEAAADEPVAAAVDDDPGPADDAPVDTVDVVADTAVDTPEPDDTPPPVSWNAAEREHWNSVPKEARDAVARREREMDLMLNKTAPVRKFGETMQQVISPYEQMLQQQGSNPVQAVQRMLGVADGLTRGTSQQKAQMISGLMQQYGVDVQELANVISGDAQPDPNAQIQQQVEQQVQQRMHPFMQQQEQAQQQQAQAIQQELTTFASNHEFYNDLRNDMADIMDLREQRGDSVSLEQAYTLAQQMNPHVKQVLDQRMMAERQQRQAAAGSLKPGGGAPPPQGHDDSLRGNLMDAWDTLQSQ